MTWTTTRRRQSGSTSVEFALVFLLFMCFLLGITDFARMLFLWGAANEATRYGARFAAICDDTTNAAKVLARMQAVVPQITSINVAWDPAGCTAATCQGVAVTITGLQFQWLSPIPGTGSLPNFALPTFSTYLPRESMKQDATAAAVACT